MSHTAARPIPWTEATPGHRVLHINQIIQLAAAHASGATPAELSRTFGISRRTVYRWREARIVAVTIDGWTARFAIRPPDDHGVREGPVQLEYWRPVEAVA